MSTQTTLHPTFAGELVAPGDPDYDTARALYNGAHDKRPAVIARCTSARDVQLALAHAREHELVVAVRGGGHSIPGHSSCDDGLVIDTGPMKSVGIDVDGRTGRFGAGLTWGEFDAATQAHGLAVTGGRVSHTGIAGLTLGSGSGWIERTCGITCDSLISVEVVTADGCVLRAGADENADLFWGVKGGGGNFGVVTEFEFRLHPVGPIVYAGMILHPRSAAPALLRFYRDFVDRAPDEVGGGVALMTAPPADFLPEAARGKPAVGLVLVYTGDPGLGESVLRPLVEWGEPWLTAVQPMPYVAVQQLLDDAHPWGVCDYSKADYLHELTDEAIDAMVEATAEPRAPFSGLNVCPLGGAVARADRGTMSLEIPDAGWFYMCEAMWWDPADAEAEIAWARSLREALLPWTVDKAPPNFIGADEGQARLRASYGPDKFGRLVALKDAYDPDNVFALNQNIPPSHAGE
ncbi:MAG: FAD-linked oxidase [Solirubrobacterales bacterium]|nr:FAD-linked oxidase [Solirubrobacterales bacterium]